MNLFRPPADLWNDWVRKVMKARALPGFGVQTFVTPEGTIVRANPGATFLHPWKITTSWDTTTAAWQMVVRPGFVDGLPPKINGTFITDADMPVLTAYWRNPLEGSIGVSDDGAFYTATSEGYPKFFETLGVRTAAQDSRSATYDPSASWRTRELRACDIILSTPRVGTIVDLTISSSDSGSTITGGTATWGDTSNIGKEFKLYSSEKWTQQAEPTALEWMLGTYVEPTVDEIKLATVYAVSPPDPEDGAEPDSTWVLYTKYFAFWNFVYSTQRPRNRVNYNNITLKTGIPLADEIGNGMLSVDNDTAQEIQNFYNATSFKGKFYNA